MAILEVQVLGLQVRASAFKLPVKGSVQAPGPKVLGGAGGAGIRIGIEQNVPGPPPRWPKYWTLYLLPLLSILGYWAMILGALLEVQVGLRKKAKIILKYT